MRDPTNAGAGTYASPDLRARIGSAILDICHGSLMDGAVVGRELEELERWGGANPAALRTYDGRTVLTRVRAALADGLHGAEERRDLRLLLEEMTADRDAAQVPPPGFFTEPLPPVDLTAIYTLTGLFLAAQRPVMEGLILAFGGTVKEGLSGATDVLLVGARVSAAWFYAEAGTTRRQVDELSALRARQGKPGIVIMPESHWATAIPALVGPPQ